MQIIAITNVKGGVGKTTTAVNLAYLAAQSGRATVLWDLDPQGAATYTLQGAPTAYAGLSLIPADWSFRNLDLHLNERKHPTERLMMMTRSLHPAIELLVLDCPPGMTLLSENVLRAADALVVPVVPAPLSLRMLDQLRDFIARTGWTDIRLLPFFSMVDRRKTLHDAVISNARTRHPEMLATEIPYWSDIERMTVRRAPLPAFAPASPAGRLYAQLWKEIASGIQEPTRDR